MEISGSAEEQPDDIRQMSLSGSACSSETGNAPQKADPPETPQPESAVFSFLGNCNRRKHDQLIAEKTIEQNKVGDVQDAPTQPVNILGLRSGIGQGSKGEGDRLVVPIK